MQDGACAFRSRFEFLALGAMVLGAHIMSPWTERFAAFWPLREISARQPAADRNKFDDFRRKRTRKNEREQVRAGSCSCFLSRPRASSLFLRAAERCLGLVAAAAGARDIIRGAEDGDQDLQNYTDIQDPEEIADQGEQ